VAVAPAPVCANREPPTWVDGAHPNDGVPDPAGRIFFSQFHRNTDVLGQIVAPLYAIDPDGSDLHQIMDCEMQRPRVSPDGTRLAFSLVMDDGWWQVATSAVDGSDLRILTSTPGFAETPDWSPDGSWLIYSHAAQTCVSSVWDTCIVDEGNRYSLWRVNADGTDPRLIGDPDNVDWEPRLSPDGTMVVFSRFHFPGLMTLVVRDLATGEERETSRTDLDLEHPDWSPDGRWIVYNPTCAPGTVPCEQIERVPADDLDATPVVLYAADDAHAGIKPAYSPDGSRIVFGCKGPMCLMDADGSNVETLVTVEGTELNHFDWGVLPSGGG
jgi:TolB protein